MNTLKFLVICILILSAGWCYDIITQKNTKTDKYYEGFQNGVILALDTVIKITENQLNSPDSVCSVLIFKDSLVYVLNNNNIKHGRTFFEETMGQTISYSNKQPRKDN